LAPPTNGLLSSRPTGRARGVLSEKEEREMVRALIETPRLMAEALALEPQVEQFARDLAKSRNVLYLGRGTSFPLALEGALKLKEISYIHAEGYAAGELKHGPIALIDESMPVIIIAPHDRVFEKTVSNMQEVVARQGKSSGRDVRFIARPPHRTVRAAFPHTAPTLGV
jgi:glucosamine--fructose-6-phosphate aminotransferase (isomerizing)